MQLETRLETYLHQFLRSLQLEKTEQLITMPVKLAMLQSKCSRVSKLLGTESETCLEPCLRPVQLYGDQAYTCLSILLATFDYRVRGMCVPTPAFHARPKIELDCFNC